jgi:hypothetical protein
MKIQEKQDLYYKQRQFILYFKLNYKFKKGGVLEATIF